MKKLLSFVIVAMMIVSSIVPVFAVAEAPAAPAEEENWFTVWAEDTTYDLEAPTQYIDIYVNVANNHELAGFEYLKFYCVYPACLTLANTQTGKPAGNSFMQSSWLTASTEHTEPDGNFIRSLYTLMGYDVGDGDETMTPEQQAVYDARTEELLGGGFTGEEVGAFLRREEVVAAVDGLVADADLGKRVKRGRTTFHVGVRPVDEIAADVRGAFGFRRLRVVLDVGNVDDLLRRAEGCPPYR